jgi:hypothetical protein
MGRPRWRAPPAPGSLAPGAGVDARCESAGALTPARGSYTPAAPAAGAHGVPVSPRRGQEGAHGSR